ncbi:MAG: rubrerythrin family protein [Armatimonadota bacterium]
MKKWLLLPLLMVATSQLFAAPTQTIKNLQTAYNGESNASYRYAQFAVKADKEGYKAVAALFRSASIAEKIHAKNHAKQLTVLKAKPVMKLDKPVVKSTAENLKAAIKGENYEATVMYPSFIKQAKASSQKGAMMTFAYANAAEVGHRALYTKALKNLAKMKAAATFYVCPVCGYTVDKLSFTNCPVCATASGKFKAVK